MRFIKIFLLVLIFFVFAVFVLQNHTVLGEDISFRFDVFVWPPFESIPLPMYFIVLAAFFIGAFICLLFLAGDRIKALFALRRAHKRIRVLEQEVASLRALPLTPRAYKADSNKTDTLTTENKSVITVPASDAAALPSGNDKPEDSSKDGQGDKQSDSVDKL